MYRHFVMNLIVNNSVSFTFLTVVEMGSIENGGNVTVTKN